MDEKKLEEMQKQIDELMAKNETLSTENAKAMSELEKAKKAVTKSNEEAANWKRELRATQDEETRKAAEKAEEEARKEAERAEEMRVIKTELATMRAEKRVSTYTAKLMASGYDAQTAAMMAANLPEGIGEDFFESQKTFIENQKQAAKAEALNLQPGPTPGTPPKPADKDAAEIESIMKAAGVKGV